MKIYFHLGSIIFIFSRVKHKVHMRKSRFKTKQKINKPNPHCPVILGILKNEKHFIYFLSLASSHCGIWVATNLDSLEIAGGQWACFFVLRFGTHSLVPTGERAVQVLISSRWVFYDWQHLKSGSECLDCKLTYLISGGGLICQKCFQITNCQLIRRDERSLFG